MQPEIDQQACEGEEERWGARQACGGRTGVITAGSWLAAASWKVHPGRRVSVVIPPGLGSFRLRRPQHTELTHEDVRSNIRPLPSIQGAMQVMHPASWKLGYRCRTGETCRGRRWLDRAYQEGEYLGVCHG